MKTQYLNILVVFVILFMMILIALIFAIVTESMTVAAQSLIMPTVAPEESCINFPSMMCIMPTVAPVEICLNDYTMCINHIYLPLVLKGY